MDLTNQILLMLGTSVITTGGVVGALRVHILYIREKLKGHDVRLQDHSTAITRAHQRIDKIEQRCMLRHAPARAAND